MMVLACRKVEVAGARCKERKRKTWKECVDKDMKVLGLHPEWAVFRMCGRIWAKKNMGKCLTLAYCGRNGCFQNK